MTSAGLRRHFGGLWIGTVGRLNHVIQINKKESFVGQLKWHWILEPWA